MPADSCGVSLRQSSELWAHWTQFSASSCPCRGNRFFYQFPYLHWSSFSKQLFNDNNIVKKLPRPLKSLAYNDYITQYYKYASVQLWDSVTFLLLTALHTMKMKFALFQDNGETQKNFGKIWNPVSARKQNMHQTPKKKPMQMSGTTDDGWPVVANKAICQQALFKILLLIRIWSREN